MYKILTTLGLALGLVWTSLSGAAPKATRYVFDDGPFKKYEKLATEWQKLHDDGFKSPATVPSLKRQVDILEEILKSEPEWIDGYWLLSEMTFHYASALTSKADREEARAIFLKGQTATETCLKKAPTNALCKMFLGAALGKIASIDGIFSSLKTAQRIEKIWLEVSESGVDYPLTPRTTLQGSVHYALGIFYRLVPDVTMLRWIFGTKGDIKRSVTFHQLSVDEDGKNTCNLMMLGIAKLCSVKGDAADPVGKDGLKDLAEAKTLPVTTALTKTCAHDIPKIEKDTSLACGYDQNRQQESSDDDIKALEGTSKPAKEEPIHER